MGDRWWGPDQDYDDKEYGIGYGFEADRDRNRTGVPEDVQPISEVRGGSLGGTQYGYRKTDSGLEFWNLERGERVEGEEAQAAQSLYQDLESRRSDINDRNAARREQPASAQRETASAPAQAPGTTVRDGTERSRPSEAMSDTGVRGVTFDRFSAAGFDTPDDAEFEGGVSPSRITSNTARSLTPESAKRLYERTFNKPVPADMSPQEALAEELRGMKR